MSCHFKITIPEPCEANWKEMKNNSKGKYCDFCHKTVYDFSAKSPAEIQTFFTQHKGDQICGYFKHTQVDVPLLSETGNGLMTVTKLFAIAVYLVFGSLLFSCKPLPEPEPEGPVFIKGRLKQEQVNSDSSRARYGGIDYMEYFTEEISDTLINQSE